MDELQNIQNLIYEIRGVKVMLDKDLADLYHVTTGNLNKAVKRNQKKGFLWTSCFNSIKKSFKN